MKTNRKNVVTATQAERELATTHCWPNGQGHGLTASRQVSKINPKSGLEIVKVLTGSIFIYSCLAGRSSVVLFEQLCHATITDCVFSGAYEETVSMRGKQKQCSGFDNHES